MPTLPYGLNCLERAAGAYRAMHLLYTINRYGNVMQPIVNPGNGAKSINRLKQLVNRAIKGEKGYLHPHLGVIRQ